MTVDLFPAEPDGTEAALMRATYDALCEWGYADLTIQRIGDEFPKSKSLIYQHYNGKDELLRSLLTYLLDRFETQFPENVSSDPVECLLEILEYTVAPGGDTDRTKFRSAIIELRAQAAHDEAYRRHFSHSDQVFHSHLAGVIEAGIETGAFRAVDPEREGALLLSILNGAMLQRATTDRTDLIETVHDAVTNHVEDNLLAVT